MDSSTRLTMNEEYYDFPFGMPWQGIKYDPLTLKEVNDVIGLLEDWFLIIEKGIQKLPDMSKDLPSMEEADKLIKLTDDYISHELENSPNYWHSVGKETKGKPIDKPADFNRLKGAARIAFCQDIKQVLFSS